MAGIALASFLADAARSPFIWGTADCCTFPADWVYAHRGQDPMAPLRGRYRTAIGAARLLRREGGLEAVWTRMCAATGLEAVSEASPGDIALVVCATPAGEALLGAVRTPLAWAMRAAEGLIVQPAQPRLIWRP